MKKFKNIFLAFAAISALSLAFVSCSDDSDDDSTSDSTPHVTDYTLDIATLVELGNVKAASKDTGSTTGVTKVWASASGKSIQAFGADSSGSAPFVKMTGGGVNVTSGSEYGLQVKVDAAATVTITALTKQTKTAGQWILKSTDGGTDVESTGTAAVASAELKEASRTQSTEPATLTFSNVAAGTYMLAAKSDGGYLFSLGIDY